MEKNKTLKDLIIESGMTHQQIADALGVSQPMISNWMRPGKDMRISTIAKLCKVLKVSPKTIMMAAGIDVDGIPDDFAQLNGQGDPEQET